MGEGFFNYVQTGSGMLPWLAVFATAVGGGLIVGAGYLLIRKFLPGHGISFRRPLNPIGKTPSRKATRPARAVIDGRAATSAYRQADVAPAPVRRNTEKQEWQSRALNLYMERITELQARLNRVNAELESYLIETRVSATAGASSQRVVRPQQAANAKLEQSV